MYIAPELSLHHFVVFHNHSLTDNVEFESLIWVYFLAIDYGRPECSLYDIHVYEAEKNLRGLPNI
jgi:hypothetical protein